MKPKPIADHYILRDLAQYLLVADELTYSHERIRIQLIFSMMIMSYTGCRPGSIVEPRYHRGSNEGLWYKDVEAKLIKTGGGPKFVLSVKFRNRKHRRTARDG
jgi:hypothetical protein